MAPRVGSGLDAFQCLPINIHDRELRAVAEQIRVQCKFQLEEVMGSDAFLLESTLMVRIFHGQR